MNYRFARTLSIIFHPVLMPTYALLLVFQLSRFLNYVTPDKVKEALYLIVTFNTLIAPLFIAWLLLRRGWIKSFNMERRQERIVPYLSNAILMMVAYYMLRQLGLPKLFYLLLLGAATSVVFAVVINLVWKISIHMIGVGGVVGMFFGMSEFLLIDLRIPILIALLVAGLIGTARLSLGAHHPMQIYAGFFVGFLCEYFILAI